MQSTKSPESATDPRFSDPAPNLVQRPEYLLVALASAIFAGEAMVMFFLHFLADLTPFQKGVVDAALLTIIVFPVLYLFVFSPMRTQIDRRRRAEQEKDLVIVELQKALSEVKTLRGIVPICSSCKNVRDDKGYWNAVEDYVTTHAGVMFSHGICPECVGKIYARYV